MPGLKKWAEWGLVSNMCALQAWGPEFEPRTHEKKKKKERPGLVIPALGRSRQVDSWELSGQQAFARQWAQDQWESLSQKAK